MRSLQDMLDDALAENFQLKRQLERMPLHVNSDVWIKTTELGKTVAAVQSGVVTGDGWEKWKLWKLMEVFGPHMGLGARPMFEVDIHLTKPDEPGPDLPPSGGPPIDDMLRTAVAMATVLGAEVDLIRLDDRLLVEGVLGRRVSWVSAGGHVEHSGIVDSDGWEVKFVRYPISSSAGAASVAEQVFGGIETVVRRLARSAGARRIKVGVKPGASDDHVWIGGLAVGPTEAPS